MGFIENQGRNTIEYLSLALKKHNKYWFLNLFYIFQRVREMFTFENGAFSF